jgi:hypothetical protein
MFIWREYVSGASGGILNIAVTFPLHKTMFRQMVHGISVTPALKQLHREGLIRLYRGALPPFCQQAVARSLMFGKYGFFTRQIRELYPHLSPLTVLTSASYLAGSAEALFTPFERLQVLLEDRKQNRNYTNTADALRKLKTNFGITEFYRGVSAITFRNGARNVLFFYAKERSRDWHPASTKNINISKSCFECSFLLHFLTGSVIGAAVSTLLYPLKGIIFHMQLKVGGSYLRFSAVLGQILKERGFKGLWHGVHVNYTRSFISWGVINATYEIVHDYLK